MHANVNDHSYNSYTWDETDIKIQYSYCFCTPQAKQLEEKAIQIAKPPEQQQISRWVANTNRKLHSRASR